MVKEPREDGKNCCEQSDGDIGYLCRAQNFSSNLLIYVLQMSAMRGETEEIYSR